MSDTKMITIFNQRFCGYLMMKGSVLIVMSENKHCPNKNVFFFNNSNDLQRSINEFKSLSMKSN